MNYYIQGSAARADKIKAAFKKLGYNSRGLDFFDFSCGFFYTVERDVHYCVFDYMVNIIKTHPDYQELELPIEPKFKVGDSLQSGSHFTKILSINLEEGRYYCDNRIISFKNQDLWHLVPKPHYDISNFHAGMPVLVRDNEGEEWRYTTFSHVTSRFYENKFAAGCTYWSQCIPFNDDTKHLLGTTDMCDEMYINW